MAKNLYKWVAFRRRYCLKRPRLFLPLLKFEYTYVSLLDPANEQTSGLKVTLFNIRYSKSSGIDNQQQSDKRIAIYTMEPIILGDFGP